MSEKPLHVRVAEALGMGVAKRAPAFRDGWCVERPEDAEGWRSSSTIPRFDTDWAAAGPLLEQYQIQLSPSESRPERARWFAGGRLRSDPGGWYEFFSGFGPTPLVALCHCILDGRARMDALKVRS